MSVRDESRGSTHVAVFRIEGMTCGVCSGAVERALRSIDGVREATVSFATHNARVEFDSKGVIVDTLVDAVEDIGFGATLLEETCIAPLRTAAARVLMLRIEGMTCGVCSAAVEKALRSSAGVSEATVSFATHNARVHFDPSTTCSDDLVEAVEDIGFGATVLEEQNVDAGGNSNVAVGRGVISIELKLRGMTCAACSGGIERLLRGLAGVERATVSLVLSRAFVVCDSSKLTGEMLCSEIEDIGFEAEVENICDASELNGRAHLHLKLEDRPEKFEECARSQNGVLGCRRGSHAFRITYDPYAVGARSLLENLKDKYTVEWVNSGSENEQLQMHLAELASLRRSLFHAMPTATFALIFTIALPSLGIHHTSFWLLAWKMHHGIDLFTFLMLVMATPVQFFVAQRFHSAAWRALKRKSANMDVLVSIATNVAYFYSVGLIVFCMLTPNDIGAHALVAASVHFLAMGPILIGIVLLGKFLEANAKLKAMETLCDLPASRPETTTLCSEDGTEFSIPVELVQIGDALRVFAGGKIPVDGTVCSDATLYVDESLLTGESAPVSKSTGDQVLGGTTCVSGGCLMRVTKVGCDTTLGQMEMLVMEAQASKADIQRVADKVARIFVPSVVSLAFATVLVWMTLVFTGLVKPEFQQMHGTMEGMVHGADNGADVRDSLKLLFAVKFGMAVLMIACPCAMGLATPMAVMVATGVAAKRGCLIKNAAALETAARADAVVLDKTGTLTMGSPAVSDAVCIASAFFRHRETWSTGLGKASFANKDKSKRRPSANSFSSIDKTMPALQVIGDVCDMSESDSSEMRRCFWWLLGTLESSSDHPLARCVQDVVRAIEGLPPIIAPQDFEYVSGRGVRCTVDALGGVQARVGNLSFFEEHVAAGARTQEFAELRAWVTSNQMKSHTVAIIHLDGLPFGAIALHDPIREDAAWVVQYMSHKLGLDIWLCTGDNSATAQAVAQEVGIKNVVAEALPTTKSDCVKQLQEQVVAKSAGSRKKRICFVGDGINDSVALAQADVGIAIGCGAQIAVEAAAVTLVREELSDLVAFLALSQQTLKTIFLNFFWAFCFNFVCLPVAAGIFYPKVYISPLVAGLGMASSSCLVVCSSLLIQRFRAPTIDSSFTWDLWSTSSPRGERQHERQPLTSPTAAKAAAKIIGKADHCL